MLIGWVLLGCVLAGKDLHRVSTRLESHTLRESADFENAQAVDPRSFVQDAYAIPLTLGGAGRDVNDLGSRGEVSCVNSRGL